MTYKELTEKIRQRQSYLCVGLDTDLEKIPVHLKAQEDPVFAFNKEIIDQTADLCVAYKLNLAFYEAHGLKGWESLKKTIRYISSEHLIIADAKRGDIGNTADMYAKAFFNELNVDAITIAPYMGRDSIEPFLKYNGKWTIILGLTSNPGSADFQQQIMEGGRPLYEKILTTCAQYGTKENTMFVIGATRGEMLNRIRSLIPDHFLLVPGVGAQGGTLEDLRPLMTSDVGILVNSSRAIIYAGNDESFGQRARAAALEVQKEMASFLKG